LGYQWYVGMWCVQDIDLARGGVLSNRVHRGLMDESTPEQLRTRSSSSGKPLQLMLHHWLGEPCSLGGTTASLFEDDTQLESGVTK